MSGDHHLARLERLQRMHGLLVRRQAGSLAAAQAAEQRAGERMRRVQQLLAATGPETGQKHVAELAGGALLRGLLARTLETERQHLAAAKEARLEQAERQQTMDMRAERLSERVMGARQRASADATDRHEHSAAAAAAAKGKELP